MWRRHLFNIYAEALYLAGQYAETKIVCEKLLENARDSEISISEPIFMSHLMLSYALLRLGGEPEAQKKYVLQLRARVSCSSDLSLSKTH